MARIPLIGASYVARGLIANAQRCVNLYPEINQKDSTVPFTHYQRPGFRQQTAAPLVAPVRGLYRPSTGNGGYAVIGSNVYYIDSMWALTLLGQITVGQTNLVSFIDNGTTLVLVDGSSNGWQIVLATNAFSQIADETGTFQGATKVDYIDTFVLWGPVTPGSNLFGSTLSDEIQFYSLYVAGKTDYPDPLVTLMVNRHEILLFGQLKSEIWYDAGNTGFPFAELPGAYIEHGCVAPYSVASQDISVFWLSQDLQGQGVVLRQRGYETRRISTHAIEYAIQQYATLADAIGYTYQQGGHVFYVLTFPTGDETWVYDDSTELWHQRAWTDANGLLHRDRSNCAAFINGLNIVGDWQNGTIYALDQTVFTDNVNGVAGPISWIRSFPHIGSGKNNNGQPEEGEWKKYLHHGFFADIQGGNYPLNADGSPPSIFLRWSDDRGNTWGQAVRQTLGQPGQYNEWPQWQSLGIARDRVYELSWSTAGLVPLNGAWLEAEVMDK